MATKYIVDNLTGQTINGESVLPKYKVYTALLTQSGGTNGLGTYGPYLTIGVTYVIVDDDGDNLWDFTNVGAPNNNGGTIFVATGTTPNSWGSGCYLEYNTGAPVVTVLENTIGNIWFTYTTNGEYVVNSDGLFTIGKTWGICPANTGQGNTNIFGVTSIINNMELGTSNSSNILDDNLLSKTPIEIRVYN